MHDGFIKHKDLIQQLLDDLTLEVEYSADGCTWHPIEYPCFWSDTHYRIATTPDSIPWDALSPRFNWAARDENGNVFVYTQKPRKSLNVWSADEGVYIRLNDALFAGLHIGTVDWRDSLQQRPE